MAGLLLPAGGSASVKWLCAPSVAKSPCTGSLRTTVFSSFGKRLGVVTAKRARHPKVDCFYVYPTVSNQKRTIATRAADAEIRDITLYQAARYSQVCRLFVPLYRQFTMQALFSGHLTAADQEPGRADVLAAWKQYLAKYNHGRGFVLIGHSQGSLQLIDLIRHHIDGYPKVRRRLVSAILLGGNVTVRKGSDRGGSFKNVPACRRTTQLHCVVAYSSFNQTPPANAFFGRTGDPKLQVLCTNPASLPDGSAPRRLDSLVPSKPFAPGLIAAGIQLLQFTLPKVSTPWIEAKSAFSGHCSSEGGASFLELTSLDDTPVPKASPDASWGLHLLDASAAQGNLVNLVRAQTAAYLR